MSGTGRAFRQRGRWALAAVAGVIAATVPSGVFSPRQNETAPPGNVGTNFSDLASADPAIDDAMTTLVSRFEPMSPGDGRHHSLARVSLVEGPVRGLATAPPTPTFPPAVRAKVPLVAAKPTSVVTAKPAASKGARATAVPSLGTPPQRERAGKAAPAAAVTSTATANNTPADAKSETPAVSSAAETGTKATETVALPEQGAALTDQTVEPIFSNSTGKAVSISVPLKDGNQSLAEIAIMIGADSAVSVAKSAIVAALGPVLEPKTKTNLEVVPSNGGNVSLTDLGKAGVPVRFDQGRMELIFEGSADQRKVGDISIAGASRHEPSGNALLKPAFASGFLNLYGGIDHRWGGVVEEKTSFRFDAEAVLRLGEVLIENDFGYDGAVDTQRCPIGATCLFTHQSGIKRRYSRMSYDLPEYKLRFQAGDTVSPAVGMQSTPEFLGLRIDHSPHTFSPRGGLTPTGRSSFRIERPSEVEVFVNGAPVQRLQLRPGQYNLTDLPLQAGANDIELKITDDAGSTRTLTFSAFSAASLLAPGAMEWSVSGGLPSYLRDNDREYRKNDWIATLFGRYGIADTLTGELSFQADSQVRLAGGGIYTALPWGFFSLLGSVSQSDSGVGYAAIASYDLSNIQGLSHGWTGLRESLRLSAEHRSDHFRTPGEFQATASGILLPQYDYSWRFTGAYTVPLANSVSATLSGSYQIGNPNAFKISPQSVSKDRYNVDLSVNAQLTDWLSGSVTAGWGNNSPLRDVFAPTADDPDYRVGVRLTARLGETSRIDGRYDTAYNDASVSASTYSHKGYERWDATADVRSANIGKDENIVAGASVGYQGNRGEARMFHSSGTRALDTDPSKLDHRTSLRAGTAIAFAGDSVAIGAPIRVGGFAIVSPHESIADKSVTVGSKSDPRAVADGLGPAVVGSLPPYAHVNLPVDVDDLPTGYSLGKGSYDIVARNRAGYQIEVGSANSVSAYGTLKSAQGAPLALVAGTATRDGGGSEPVTVFTNSGGRFAAEGLSPGRWTIEMPQEAGPIKFALDIPKKTQGLFRAGELSPVTASAGNKQ